jgi:hypothetical protein
VVEFGLFLAPAGQVGRLVADATRPPKSEYRGRANSRGSVARSLTKRDDSCQTHWIREGVSVTDDSLTRVVVQGCGSDDLLGSWFRPPFHTRHPKCAGG